jgi:TIR domain
MPVIDMPLFKTPMMEAPIIAPSTVPAPPEAEAPPTKTAAMTSSSKPVPARGVALLSRAAKIRPATAASTPMLTKAKNVTMTRKPSADAALARFGMLLKSHLARGTRPVATTGEPWSYKSFADKIPSERTDAVVSPRSVSNWCNGRSLPTTIEPILDALFGREDKGPERAGLLKTFRDARKRTVASTIGRAKPRPGGATWVARGRQLVMEHGARRSDAHAAEDPLQQQLQTDICEMSARLAEAISQRPTNALLISKVAATVTTLSALLNCNSDQLPDRLSRIYRHSLVLGELLDVDMAIRADNSDAPLDADIRGELSVLVRTTAPWLRGFPSVAALDDKARKLLFEADLVVPALGLLQCAQNYQVIPAEDGSDVVLALSASHTSEFRGVQPGYQGRKAATLAVGDTLNLVLAAVSQVGAAQSGIAARSADEEVLARNLAATLLVARVHVAALAATMQPDLRYAVNAVIEEVELSQTAASLSVPSLPPEFPNEAETTQKSAYVFISFPAKNIGGAKRLRKLLEPRGVRCWIAPSHAHRPLSLKHQIDDAIDGCQAVLLLFNKFCDTSAQILHEVQRAQARHIPVIPIRIDDSIPQSELAQLLKNTIWIDTPGGIDLALGANSRDAKFLN